MREYQNNDISHNQLFHNVYICKFVFFVNVDEEHDPEHVIINRFEEI